jgi:glucose-1-phosphate cytidylyltransferase
VLDTKIFQYIEDDKTVLEREPLEKLASEGELTAWKHSDFWHPMDTIRDQLVLEDLWNSGKAPWKQW